MESARHIDQSAATDVAFLAEIVCDDFGVVLYRAGRPEVLRVTAGVNLVHRPGAQRRQCQPRRQGARHRPSHAASQMARVPPFGPAGNQPPVFGGSPG
jgi:hypothetical protein